LRNTASNGARRGGFNRDAGSGGLLRQEVFHTPLDGFFGLRAVFGEALGEVSLAVKQGDGHHGQAQVRSGTNRIARKHA